MKDGLSGAALRRHAARLFLRRRGTMLFLAGCLALGIAFLSAVSHLLSAVDAAVAVRARELLGGDVRVSAERPFTGAERAALAALLSPGRRATESASFVSMLAPAASREAPFLVAVKAVDGAFPLRGTLVTSPPRARPGPGECLVERSAALQHGLKAGATVRLGALTLRIAGLIEQEPDRDFLGFSFAPRLMIARADLPRAKLLGLGARGDYAWTAALADGENPDSAARAFKLSIERALTDAHIRVSDYADSEQSVREGLRRAALFFTALSLSALLLGAAGLRAGLTLFLDAEAESMGLLRCLGATAAEVERLYGGLCVAAGLLGGAAGAAAGWALAAAGARAAARFGLALTAPPRAGIFAECLVLSAALAWGLSAARVRALASRAPLDALRETPPVPKALAAAGWAAAALAAAAAAWLRAPTTKDALLLVASLAGGALAVELLSRGALRAAERLARTAAHAGLPFPARHGLRRLVRRRAESRVMLFTLAGGFALLAAVGAAREGFAKGLAPASAPDAPNLFLVDIQPTEYDAARALAAKYARGEATFAPLVRARLVRVDGKPFVRGGSARRDEPDRERGRWRAREYNLTYADALNPAEEVVAGKFWEPGRAGAEASLESDFMEHAGLKLGSALTFDVAGREVRADVTSVRKIEWASMRPNFFVTLAPSLIDAAPRTYIASLRARDAAASAGLRRELARELPNVSVIDAAALIEAARRTLNLLLTAVGALAWFCVAVGVLVVGGLVALGRGERASEGALERALGWSGREALAADAAELLALGALAASCGALTAVGLSWALARRLEVPFAFDAREAAALFAAALFLPALSGLLAGAPARRSAALEALRRDG